MAHLWANTYEPLLCATCGYNMGMRDPDSNDTEPAYCGEHTPKPDGRADMIAHLQEMLAQGGISPEQLLNTLVDLARGGSESAKAAAGAVGANPHALDAAAAADGGWTGTAGRTFDTPAPPPPREGPGAPGADLAAVIAGGQAGA